MADNTEIEDRVDLDDDNYIEEDDDVEEQIEEEGAGEEGEDNVEGEHDEDRRHGDSGKEQLLEPDRSDIDAEAMEDDEEPKASSNTGDNEKHAELLSLPPQGSEVFIGGLPRDVSEEDLRGLCDSMGEIFEVSCSCAAKFFS